jgi:hypothetical protein
MPRGYSLGNLIPSAANVDNLSLAVMAIDEREAPSPK